VTVSNRFSVIVPAAKTCFLSQDEDADLCRPVLAHGENRELGSPPDAGAEGEAEISVSPVNQPPKARLANLTEFETRPMLALH